MRTGRICTLVLFIISLATFSFAQTDTTMGEQAAVNKSRSLQFHLVGGYSLSYKYETSGTYALRYSVDVSLGFSNSNQDYNSGSDSPSYTSRNNGESSFDGNSQSLDISMHFLYPVAEMVDLHPFVGFGPLVSFRRSFSEDERTSSSTGSTVSYHDKNENSSRSLGFGAIGIAGIEYNASETFSLLAEYRARATYNWNKQSSESKSVESNNRSFWEAKGSAWYFNLDSIRVGVGVHF